MEILRSRKEKGYGLNLYLVKEQESVKVKASKIEEYEENGKTLSAPLDVHIAITNKCNMMCPYCYAKDKDFSAQKDMSLHELFSVIDKCNEANVFKLSWSGGEPLCREELFEVLNYANERGFKQSIITNGTLLDINNIRILKKLNIAVQISLHELNDKKFWEKCSLLVKEKIDTIVDVVMDEKIIGKVQSIVESCRKTGIKNVKFGPVIPIGMAQNIGHNKTYKEVIKKLIVEIELVRKTTDVKIITQFDNREYKNSIIPLRTLLCEGATTLIYIDNNGNVYPCPLLKSYPEFFAGNILESNIFDLWNNAVMEQYRTINSEETGCAECNQICGVWCRGLTIAYTGDVKAHSPFCDCTVRKD